MAKTADRKVSMKMAKSDIREIARISKPFGTNKLVRAKKAAEDAAKGKAAAKGKKVKKSK